MLRSVGLGRSRFSGGFAVPRPYTTTFPTPENPISQGGIWLNGGTVGLDWTDCSIPVAGQCIGHEVGASLTDAHAMLTGTWNPVQWAKATVFSANQNDAFFQEVELHLRWQLSAHVSRGYEISFKCSQTSEAYCIIVRWNGALGDFTELRDSTGAQFGVKQGDVVAASIDATGLITAYKNGVAIATATDTVWTDGNPGLGFNLENGPGQGSGTNGDYGYTSYTAGEGAPSL